MAFKLAIIKSFGRTLRILVDANKPGCSTDLSSVRKHMCSGHLPQADGGGTANHFCVLFSVFWGHRNSLKGQFKWHSGMVSRESQSHCLSSHTLRVSAGDYNVKKGSGVHLSCRIR